MRSVVRIGDVPKDQDRRVLVVRLLCTVSVCALLSPAEADAQVATKSIVMMGKGSGKCVAVAGASQANGAGAIQNVCDDLIGNRWTLRPPASGTSPHVMVVASHSGKCLSVSGGSTANDALVVQSDCTGVDSQLWTVASFGGFHRLIAKHSGQCLNVRWGVRWAGGSLVQWPCEGGANEIWSLSDGHLGPTDTVRIANVASHFCVDIQYGSTADGAGVIQWHCKRTGITNQSWTLQRASSGYQVRVQSSGKCLAPVGGSTASGAAMVQVTCGTALSQVWSVEAVGSEHNLVNKTSGLCLDVGGDPSALEAPLVQRACSGAATQAWRVGNVWERGTWSERIELPLVPVAAAALKNNKVMFWSAFDNFKFTIGTTVTQTVLYDLATETYQPVQVSNTGHDMFCPGTALLPDGRLLVNGGSTSNKTSIYDPVANSWSNGGDMKVPRGYNADVVTSTGKVFTIGGSWSGDINQNKAGELWNAPGSWTLLSGIPSTPMLGPDNYGVYRGDNHAWLFGIESGKVFHAGPSAQMNWFDPSGTGSYSSAGNRGGSGYSMNGNAVMYDINRILTLGGAPSYDYTAATNRADKIDINSGVQVTQTGSMTYARAFANGVVLPDGKVFVAGGQSFAEPFSDATAILPSELWDPTTGIFSITASEKIPRTYHSVALLLPDARVLVGGGGLCGSCDTNHPNFEYYAPGYLFTPGGEEAVRPAIVSAPTTTTYNTQITVTTDNSNVSKFVLIRMGAATHTVDNDQRRIPLTVSGQSGSSYLVTTPAHSGIGTPGYYMLFAIDTAGVPSKAAIIKLG